jgi:hypothetical protein
LRCAWCDSLNLEDEWLQLDALGVAGPQIAASILDRASHGICPECLDRELRRSATLRPSA